MYVLKLHCPDTEEVVGAIAASEYNPDKTSQLWDEVTKSWETFCLDEDEIDIEAFAEWHNERNLILITTVTIDYYQP